MLAALGPDAPESRVCFQSRATPEPWLAPSTDEEVRVAGADRTALLVVPIAFVSEHSETLVELDVEYRHLADRLGVPGYFRVSTPGADAKFISGLAGLVRGAVEGDVGIRSHAEVRICPDASSGCPCAAASAFPARSPAAVS